MTTPFEHLVNGSIIKAGYETYNQAFTFHGVTNLPIGILYLVFMVLLYIAVRDIGIHFLVSLVMFAIFFTMIPVIVKGIIITILLLELSGIIYSWFTD